MPVMTSQIWKSVDLTETQQSRYLEKKTIFSLQLKKIVNYRSRAILW